MKSCLKTSQFKAAIFSTFLAVALAGCTHVTKVVYHPPPTPVTRQFASSVDLRLSDAFCTYKHSKSRMGDKFEIPLGPGLRAYATNVAEALFEKVNVVMDKSGRPAPQPSQLILEPRVAKVDELIPGWLFEQRKLLVVVEWSVKDAKNGNLLLLLPVEGTASRSPGNAFAMSDNARVMVTELLSNLTTNTLRAFSASRELAEASNRK